MSQPLTRSGFLMLIAMVLPTPPGPTYAIDRPLTAVVPEGPLVAVFVDPTRGDSENRSIVEMAAIALNHARRMGLLSGLGFDTSLILDTLAAWPILARQPFAVVLADIQARRHDDGHRLSGMRLGLLLNTQGANEGIVAAIQQFLNRYTNSTVSQVEAVARAAPPRHRLIDWRLPDWALVEWGPVGDYYLISLGQGAFDELAGSVRGEGSCLGDDEAFSEAFDALTAERASAAWCIDFSGLRLALAPAMNNLPQQVLEVLQLSRVDSAVWAFAWEDRAVRFESFQRIAGRGELVRIASQATEAELAGGVIPPQADRYVLIHWQPKSLVLSVRDAYLRARSPSAQAKLRQFWSDLERELDISIERDLLHQLGNRLLLHTDPPHPLGIAALCTIQIEISGSATLVRSTIDKLLRRRQRHMTPRQETDHSRDQRSFLRHADDGIWYLQFGFYGPALAVHQRWIVISFSPQAVRQNITRLAGPTSPKRAKEPNP